MKRLLSIFLLVFPLTSYAQFDRWFEDKTMRFDYLHSGDAHNEEYYFKGIYEEPHWAGSKNSLIDDRGYGNQFFKIIDCKTGETIYSRGYNTLWNEWQTTEEASRGRMDMRESLVFPYPKDEVFLEIYSRDNGGELVRKDVSRIYVSDYPKTSLPYDTFDIVVNGDPEHCVDIVLLPEGYTESERSGFEAACGKFAKDIFSFGPYEELRYRFNIRAVWVPSQDSGVTIPSEEVWKETSAKASFGTFGIERYQMVEDFQNLRDQAAHVPYEYIYILSNTNKYGGGGIYNFYGISSANLYTGRAKVYIHELGHLFAGLGDEYVGNVAYGDMYPAGIEPWEENLTTLTDFQSKAWSAMLPEGTQVPTPLTADSAEQLGVYQGGGYVSEGVYRPWPNCLMNNLHKTDKFCPVCEKAIRDQIEFICR